MDKHTAQRAAKRTRHLVIDLLILTCVTLPVGMASLVTPLSTKEITILFGTFGLTFAGSAAVLYVASRSHRHWVRLGAILYATLQYTLLYFLMYYVHIRGNLFDPILLDLFAFDITNATRVVGTTHMALYLALMTLTTTLFFTLFRSGCTQLSRWQPSKLIYVPLSLVLIFSIQQIPTAYGHFIQTVTFDDGAETADARLPDNTQYATDSRDNVFILQLESTNALALAGKLSYEGKKYDGDYMPEMRKIAKDGTFFPFFLGNQQQTVRASVAILCGIAGNTKEGYWERSGPLPVECLPQLLHKSGYHTRFLKGANNPSFMNHKNLVARMGYDEILFSDAVMRDGDPTHRWGSDDCAFYRRAFEYLRRDEPDPSREMVLIQATMNHQDFGLQDQYRSVVPFPDPQNRMENLLNGSFQQDYCLQVFYEEFQEYAPGNTHLIIVADHPFAISDGYQRFNGHTDNYMVPFVYVPPRNTKEHYRTGHVDEGAHFSQTDILPTIFSLLGPDAYAQSFDNALRKSNTLLGSLKGSTPDHGCELVHSIYDGAYTAVIDGPNKYTYSHKDGAVYWSDIRSDLIERNRKKISEGVTFEQFKRLYYCPRYL